LLHCDFVGGCDGFHGISRKCLPPGSFQEYRIEYPFSWLGILAYSKPVYHELVYAYHDNGFALASMRSEKVSRLYLQVPNDEKAENWSDERLWDELETRLSLKLDRGEIFEKGITPMRSFMIDKMQHGRLFLAGDAAHIVPPTGAKGLNLAVADVHNLAGGLVDYFHKNDPAGLDTYTERCLRRVWRVQDFSSFMTTLCHKMAEAGSFEQGLQQSRFDYLRMSEAYRKTISENYVGLPFALFQ
jgi:p-hydroxybenzoate 3-monooxygenase